MTLKVGDVVGVRDVLSDRFRAWTLRLLGARLGEKTRIGARCVVHHAAGFSCGARCHFEHDVFIKLTSDHATVDLGREVFVGRGVEFDISHALSIGSHTLIAPGCFITDHSHKHVAGRTIASQGCEGAPVSIGSDVWLGANVVVLAGVHIADGAVVAAGAVVRSSVGPMQIVAGVPARVVGQRN